MESVKVNISNEFYNLLSEDEKKKIHSYLLELGCILELKDEFPLPDIGSLVFGADVIELIEIISASGKDGLDLLAKHDNEIIQKAVECIGRYNGSALLICLFALSVKTLENKRIITSRSSVEEKDTRERYSIDREMILTSLVEKLKYDKESYANRRIYGASISELFTAGSCFSGISFYAETGEVASYAKAKTTGSEYYYEPKVSYGLSWICLLCPELCR